jgi:hypothetical protein
MRILLAMLICSAILLSGGCATPATLSLAYTPSPDVRVEVKSEEFYFGRLAYHGSGGSLPPR